MKIKMATVSSVSGQDIGNVGQMDFINEFNLLPSIFEIIQMMQEKYDAQEMTKKVNAFKAKLQNCRELLEKIPGLEMSSSEQNLLFEKCKNKHKEKCDVLMKYKSLPVFTDAIIRGMGS